MRLISTLQTFPLIRGPNVLCLCGHLLFQVLQNWSGLKLCVIQCTFTSLYFAYLTTNEIWKSCIIDINYTWKTVLCIFFWYHSFFIHDFQMKFTVFPLCTGPHIATSICTQSILILQKLIKMTTHTEYVAPRAENPTEADFRFSSYKTIIILVSRKHVYMLYEPHGSTVYKTFCMANRRRIVYAALYIKRFAWQTAAV